MDIQHSGKLYLASHESWLPNDCHCVDCRSINLVMLATRRSRTVTKLVMMGINIAKEENKVQGLIRAMTRVQHSPISGNDVTLMLERSRGPLVKEAAGSKTWSTLLAFRHLREHLDSFLSARTALGLVLPDGGSILHPPPTLSWAKQHGSEYADS